MNTNITYNRISQISHELKQEISRDNQLKINSIYYGYNCPLDINTSIQNKTIILQSLDRLKKGFYYGATCVKEKDIQSIIEKALSYININKCQDSCPEVSSTDEKLKEWTLRHPACVSYDSYERFAKEFCGDIGLQVTLEREVCDLTMAIIKEVVDCDILLSATAYTEACNLNLKVDSTIEQCRIDHNLLVEQGHEIEYKDFKKLIQKGNVSYEMVQSVYSKGNILFLGENGEVVLKTPYSEHIFSDLCANQDALLQKLPSTTTISQLLKAYK